MKIKIARRAALAGLPLALVAFAASPAQAKAPVLHVTRSVVIKAPAAKVWSVVHNFGDLTWVPAVKGSKASKGNHPGSVRHLDLGGPVLTEQLLHYNPKHTNYTYEIQHTANNMKILPVRDYVSTISVHRLGADKTKLVWSGHFRRLDLSAHPKKGEDNATAVKAISGIYESGLANAAKLATK
ncbi:MAG TPA: SRPBCC family protein [Acidiphilium sp.]|nr:SRPBCC family protein [Acidiphilium sp.]